MPKSWKTYIRYIGYVNPVHNILVTIFFLLIATLLSAFFCHLLPINMYFPVNNPEISINSINTALIYALALIMIARYTTGFLSGLIASLIGTVCINYLFTYPYFTFKYTLNGCAVTFSGFLLISFLAAITKIHMRKQSEELARHEELLMNAEKEKMRANLLRAVSHDLRTPLTGIIGASTAYLENSECLSEKEKQNLVKHIFEDSNWLLGMVENLLSVTRIHNQCKSCLTKSLEPVEEVVSGAVTRVRERNPDAKIKVSVPNDLIMIRMDPILIEQVIINLLENAIVHSKSTQPIQCNVFCEDNLIYFAIRDFGIGIPNDRLETIFDDCLPPPSDSANGHKGMGLGLSICKTIISAHNGAIIAKNHPAGAEFCFTLSKEDSTYATKDKHFNN